MARRNRNKTVNEEEIELDEVDSFNANREKILLDEAGEYGRDDQSEEDDSEEEVMQVEEDSEGDEEDQEDEEEEEEEEEGEEEEEEKGWGGRQNYYGGDDVSDDEDAKQMTEEALRQQKKHLQELAMDDYLDDEMMEDWQKKADSYDNKDTSSSTQQQQQQQLIIESNSSIANLEDSDKLKLLQQSFPEFIPLLKELNSLKVKLEDLQKLEDKNKCIETKIVALSAYLGAISSYFAIFVDNLNNEESFVSMKDNPIMETILSSREIWRQANELPDDIKLDDVKVHVSDVVSSSDIDDEDNFVDAKEEQSEDEEISEEEVSQDEDEDQSDDLDIDANSERIIKHVSKKHGDDFTEADIEDIDMEDKQRRKKTLRFYTSKIDKAAAKKDQSYSGDIDVPYKERLFERQQRLLEEARKRGLQKQDDENISDNDNDNDGVNDDEGFEQGDDYYESIKQHKLNKKQSRKSAHEAAVKAAKEGKLAELQEAVGQDGKRAINYQILKNKGLTPHRKKEYRNSRVKKRKQYEKAQKKLKSVRQVMMLIIEVHMKVKRQVLRKGYQDQLNWCKRVKIVYDIYPRFTL
ncbi:Sas10 C-terminal domain family protein [Candida albicans]|uniref:Sas10 C-terminal domain family protein n=1 Tax=Candida albicans TaxID=5476 RepID=A0A8H6BW34_CANAX|nr:Sas10 C-terminal domain family protein [Candida albicans]